MLVRKVRGRAFLVIIISQSKRIFNIFIGIYKRKRQAEACLFEKSEYPETICSHNDVRGINDVHGSENDAFPSAGFFLGVCKDDHQCGHTDQNAGIDGHCGAGGHGRDRAGETENEENVEEARTDDVTHSNAGVAFLCGYDRGNELGERSTKGNDGKTDQRFAHSEREASFNDKGR